MEPFYCQELLHNCCGVRQRFTVKETETAILLHLWSHTCNSLRQTTQNFYVKFFNNRLVFQNKFFVHHSFTTEKQDKYYLDFWKHKQWFWTNLNHILPLC